MSRTRSLAAAVLLLASSAFGGAVKDVPWADPGHARYFKYQDFLVKQKLEGETKDSWTKLKAEQRAQKADEGEAFLRKRLEELLQKEYLSGEEAAMIKAVWGDAAEQGVQRVATARKLHDPAQVELALKSVKPMLGKAAEKIDWNDLFDGAKPGAAAPAAPENVDYTKPKAKTDFLSSLNAPDVKAVLASKKTFADFLRQRGVPPFAIPALLAMYDVHTKASSPEKEELSHILPTVARFLLDGKPITSENSPGACGLAYPGEYDNPDHVAVMPNCSGTDPLIVGDILTHEFQHIYDMYTGRYYSLDSEMRGFKTGVMFFRALKKESPKKAEELLSSTDDMARSWARRWVQTDADLTSGPKAFGDQIAFGQGYVQTQEGVFNGRLSLRDAVDPKIGAERELAAKTVLRENAKKRVQELEAEVSRLEGAYGSGSHTRALDRDLEKASRDLEGARAMYASYVKDVTIRTIRLDRMRSEAAWLDKKGVGQKDPDPYDLRLQVDKDYVTP